MTNIAIKHMEQVVGDDGLVEGTLDERRGKGIAMVVTFDMIVVGTTFIPARSFPTTWLSPIFPSPDAGTKSRCAPLLLALSQEHSKWHGGVLSSLTTCVL